MKYALVGFGRMGRAIDGVAASRGHQRLAIAGRGWSAAELRGADVAFEFTRPDVAEAHVIALLEAGIPVVCGTTGWHASPALGAAVVGAAAGVVLAPNFSVGVNLFFRVVDHAARLLGQSGLFDPYVQELHHRGKRDSPSGTARRLAAALVAGDPRRRRVVEGNPAGLLPEDAVQVVSTRAGSEPGSHTVGFDGSDESIVIRHRARSREGFAQGAVLAGEWLGRRPGLHSFEPILEALLDRSWSRDDHR